MKSIKILTVGALTSSLVVGAGCAGKGLKGMFARNETAGYSTLQELEAREAAAPKDAVADSSGPRFAPWLPFGKKSETADSVASTDRSATAATEPAETQKGLLRNPFRKQETIEPDPFLNGPADTSIAEASGKTGTPAESTSKTSPSTRTASLSKDVGAAGKDSGSSEDVPEITSKKPASRSASPSVNSVAKTGKPDVATEESDAELVARFEKHFQKNTLEAAEDADALIVAGKDAAKTTKQKAATATKPNTAAADRKLAELEDLLKSRKTKESDRVTQAVADESDSASETIRQLSGNGSDQVAKHTAKPRRAVSSAEASANREFDRLFDSASHRMTEGSSNSSETNSSDEEDVAVAEANELFGPTRTTARRSTSKPVRSVSAKRNVDEEAVEAEATDSQDAPAVTPSRSTDEAEAKGIRWQSQNLRSRGQQFLKDSVKQSAQTLANTARGNGLDNFLPPAPAPDVPEPSGRAAVSEPLMIPADSTASSAVATRTEMATPAGLTEDSFFAASGAPATATTSGTSLTESAPTVPSEEAVAAPVAASSGLLSRVTLRSWILLIGGVVVVALLYLPGRKTQAPATTAQA